MAHALDEIKTFWGLLSTGKPPLTCNIQPPNPMAKSGATLARGKSKQDYTTPAAFIDAVTKRFGPLAVDLAAYPHTAKAPLFFGEEHNSLVQDWAACQGNLWLNPPFANIAPWAKKCAEESKRGAKILFLVPASVGACWFRDYVHGQAKVYFLVGRLAFGNCPGVFPKDCILAIYGEPPAFECWTWK